MIVATNEAWVLAPTLHRLQRLLLLLLLLLLLVTGRRSCVSAVRRRRHTRGGNVGVVHKEAAFAALS